MAMIMDVRGLLSCDLICISLVINDVEHLFICMSLVKCLVKSFAHFLLVPSFTLYLLRLNSET
jgi:hypothetical protein